MMKPVKKIRVEAAKAVNVHAHTDSKNVQKIDPWLLEKHCRILLTSLTIQENEFVKSF
jgi:hypothetical protein